MIPKVYKKCPWSHLYWPFATGHAGYPEVWLTYSMRLHGENWSFFYKQTLSVDWFLVRVSIHFLFPVLLPPLSWLWVQMHISPFLGVIQPLRLLKSFWPFFSIVAWALAGGLTKTSHLGLCSKISHFMHIARFGVSVLVLIYCKRKPLW